MDIDLQLSKVFQKVATGISIPRDLKEKIDLERGEVSRSRFVLKLLERAYNLENINNNSEKEQRLLGVRNQTSAASVTSTKPRGGKIDLSKEYKR